MKDEDRLVNVIVGGEKAVAVSVKLLKNLMLEAEEEAIHAGLRPWQLISKENPHSHDFIAAKTAVETTKYFNS